MILDEIFTMSSCYSFAGAAVCLPCPHGKSCHDPSQDPESCPKGYYSLIGAASCQICDTGLHGFANGTGCEPCAAGYYCPNPR